MSGRPLEGAEAAPGPVSKTALTDTSQEVKDRQAKDAILAVRDCYVDDARAYVRFLDARGLSVGYESLVEYAAFLKDEKRYAAATINKRLCGAKSRVRLLFRDSDEALDVLARYKLEELMKEIKGMKRNPRGVDLNRTLNQEEVDKLLAAKIVPQRVKLLIEFLAATGVRVSEMINIRPADIEEIEEHFSIRLVGKGDKERRLRVSVDLIRRIREVFAGTRYLFETVAGGRFRRQYVSRQVRVAGAVVIKRRISAHTFRHTFATLQIRRHGKIKATSIYLGHSSTAITQDMYQHDELSDGDLSV